MTGLLVLERSQPVGHRHRRRGRVDPRGRPAGDLGARPGGRRADQRREPPVRAPPAVGERRRGRARGPRLGLRAPVRQGHERAAPRRWGCAAPGSARRTVWTIAAISTARDLMTLTRAAMAIPRVRRRSSRPSSARSPGPTAIDRHIQNRDVMLWLYEGATGVKTGYTSRAGYCVVATAERDGRRLVAVVLGAPGDAFSDAAALLDHGFAAFTEHTFVDRGRARRRRRRSREAASPSRSARTSRRSSRSPRSTTPASRSSWIRRRRTRPRRGSGSHGSRSRCPASPSAASRWWSRPCRRLRRSTTRPWWARAVGRRGGRDRHGRRRDPGLSTRRSPAVPRIGGRPAATLAPDDGGRERPVRARGHPPPGRGARPRHHRGLRGARTRPHLGAQGRNGVPRGPDASATPPARDPFHRDQPLRRRRGVPRAGPDPAGPRRGPRPGATSCSSRTSWTRA